MVSNLLDFTNLCLALWRHRYCLHVAIVKFVFKTAFSRKCKRVSANELHAYIAEIKHCL